MSGSKAHTGAVLHCMNRGVLSRDIFDSESERWRFLEILRYKNHETKIPRWHSTVNQEAEGHRMPWPDSWGDRKPLVSIVGYTLMDNHFHLILQQVKEGGIAEFMRKLANSYIGYKQAKSETNERLFRGSYRSTRVLHDNHLRKLFVYVLVKNNFDRLNGSIESLTNDFHGALTKAREYPFSNLGGVLDNRDDQITNSELFQQLFRSPRGFKDFAKEQMEQYSIFLEEVDERFLT